MVEVRRVELLSESTSSETSPGADDYLNFPMPGASRHARGFGSFIIHGALKALRHSRTLLIDALLPNRSTFGEDGSLMRLRVLKNRCSLIYKVPIF